MSDYSRTGAGKNQNLGETSRFGTPRDGGHGELQVYLVQPLNLEGLSDEWIDSQKQTRYPHRFCS